jgi:hypothetical protein
MKNAPGREAFTEKEWEVIRRHRTPLEAQRYLRSLLYNWQPEGPTLRSFREVLRHGSAQCLEGALCATVIMEQHGFPPLVLSLLSQDGLDHALFVFRENGRWGAVGRSRDLGLHGRWPVFRSLRALAWSYYDPYVDLTGRLTHYGVANLQDLGSYDWRLSSRNIWKVQRFLQDAPHTEIKASEKRYERLLARYRKFKKEHPGEPLAYFADAHKWMF